MRVYNPDRAGCDRIKNSNIFLYWPHGFGDWVFLGYVLPLLGNGNRFWISRFGDDNVSLFEGSPDVTPVYTGHNRCNDGEPYGNRHFGLLRDSFDGSPKEVHLPVSLHRVFKEAGVETMLWSGFPETHGRVPPPFHTKARQFLSFLNPAAQNLNRPLVNTISRFPPKHILDWGRTRIENFTIGHTSRICVIGRTGYTSVGKNWGHKFREDLPEDQRYEASEAIQFIKALRRKDRSWIFVTLDEGDIANYCKENGIDGVWSFYDVFGPLGEFGVPFGLSLKSLFLRTELFVGVPAGPYHLSMIYSDFPTIGLWIEHFPSWYDEPKKTSVHLVGRDLEKNRTSPGTFSNWEGVAFDTRRQPTRHISADAVLSTVEELLY